MSLYAFTNFEQPFPRLQGAPRLVPTGAVGGSGSNFLSQDSPGYSLIDVINDFQWTTSPKSGRQEVPALFLKEKRLKTNAMMAQVAYYGLALGNVIAGSIAGFNNLPKNLQPLITGAVGGLVGNKFGQIFQGGATGLGSFLSGLAGNNPQLAAAFNIIGGGVGTLGQTGSIAAGAALGYGLDSSVPSAGLNALYQAIPQLNKYIPQRFNIDSLGSDILGPYEGLYITEDTKFLYSFPYFSDEQNSISNSFGESDGVFTGIDPLNINALAQSMRGAAGYISGTSNFDAPGIYIEKPKFFNFKEEGERIRFRFPLINTGWSTFEDVSRHWQLLYLLAYQNRPNRRSRDLIDPAVIYEVTIPGVRFYPFCYISDMSINFVGARRRMNITAPVGGGSSTVNTIVPDAYLIDITLTTLVSETQNFLYSMLQDRQNIVTVTDNNPALDILQREMKRSYNQVNLTNQTTTDPSGAQAFGRAAGDIATRLGL